MAGRAPCRSRRARVEAAISSTKYAGCPASWRGSACLGEARHHLCRGASVRPRAHDRAAAPPPAVTRRHARRARSRDRTALRRGGRPRGAAPPRTYRSPTGVVTTRIPLVRHQAVEAEVRHHGDGHQLDAEGEREDREDLVAVDGSPRSSTASMRSPSPSKATPRSSDSLVQQSVQSREVGRAAADVDVRPVGLDRRWRATSAPSRSKTRGANVGVRAVRAVDADAKPGQVGAEALDADAR